MESGEWWRNNTAQRERNRSRGGWTWLATGSSRFLGFGHGEEMFGESFNRVFFDEKYSGLLQKNFHAARLKPRWAKVFHWNSRQACYAVPIALSTADKDLPGYFLMTNTLDYFKKNFKAAKIVIVKKNATFKPAHYNDEPKFSIEIPGFDPLLESDG